LDDSAFSAEFCRFLLGCVPTIDAAELLLALAGEPQRGWHAAELAAALRPATRLSEADVRRYLGEFQAAGLVAAEPEGRCRYRPGDPALAAQVHTLARAYNERPVTLFRVIHARRPPQKVKDVTGG
jgi:hypothetical protein